jgi:predicted Rossmann fold nucleotide-binding protein DprA/Smf involved in DNA uptake
MIQKGAKLVISGSDILEEYGIDLKKTKREIKADNEIEEKILSMLTGDPVTSDVIIRKTNLEAAQVTAALVMMELNRKVKNIGNKFVINN